MPSESGWYLGTGKLVMVMKKKNEWNGLEVRNCGLLKGRSKKKIE